MNVFLFAEPCLCRTSWEGPLRHPPWPGPSPPLRPSPPTCLHVSTCVIIIVIGDGLADLVLIFALAEIWSNVNWVVMTWLKMCWSHLMFKESCLSSSWPSWPSWPCFPPQSSLRSRRSRRLGRWTTASGFTRWLFLLSLVAMWKTKGWPQSFIK